MSASIVRLPTAAPSYVRVRRRRRGDAWLVELVTPGPGRPIATILGRCLDRRAAIDYPTTAGRAMQRPVRLPRGC